MEVERLVEDRFNFLKSLYNKTNGKLTVAFPIDEIRKSLSFSAEHASTIKHYLVAKKFIRLGRSSTGKVVAWITSEGVDEVEKVLLTPIVKKEIGDEKRDGQNKIKQIFISHIHEEAALALKLKECLESFYPEQCDVFVSCDKKDLPAGKKWLPEIGEALKQADGLIVLCSLDSITRSWVNFEMGCCYIKDVNIYPICHSGLRKGELPLPISEFTALELEDANCIEDLLSGLEMNLNLTREQGVNLEKIYSELLKAPDTNTGASSDVRQSTHDNQTVTLSKEELDILLALAHSQYSLTALDLAGNFNIPIQRVKYFLDELQDKRLVGINLSYMGASTYYLTKEGRKFLFDHGHL